MSVWDTAELIRNIKRRGAIPTNQSTFENSDFLALANDEMNTVIIPDIFSLQEGYFVDYVDYAVSSDVTENTFAIPAESLFSDVQDVCLIISDGASEWPLPRLNPKFRATNPPGANQSGSSSFITSGVGYYIQANAVKLVNRAQVPSTATVRIFYYRRPNYLVYPTEAGEVVSIDSGTNLITLGNIPSDWTIGTSVCCVKGTPGFDLQFADRSLTAVSSPTIQLADITDISVGDWICTEGESAVPQIPAETIPLLAQATAIKCLEAQGDVAGVQIAQAKYDKLKEEYMRVATPRVPGSPEKVSGFGTRLFDRMGTYGLGRVY